MSSRLKRVGNKATHAVEKAVSVFKGGGSKTGRNGKRTSNGKQSAAKGMSQSKRNRGSSKRS